MVIRFGATWPVRGQATHSEIELEEQRIFEDV